MPFIERWWLIHPQTGVDGLWVKVGWSDTIQGIAKSSFPNVQGQETIAQYTVRMNNQLVNLFAWGGIQAITVTVTFSSINPFVISSVTIAEKDLTCTPPEVLTRA